MHGGREHDAHTPEASGGRQAASGCRRAASGCRRAASGCRRAATRAQPELSMASRRAALRAALRTSETVSHCALHCGELIVAPSTHREAQHGEALGAVLLVQLLQLRVLGREAARAGQVDHKANLAFEFVHLGAAAVDVLRGGGQAALDEADAGVVRRAQAGKSDAYASMYRGSIYGYVAGQAAVIWGTIATAKRRSLVSEARSIRTSSHGNCRRCGLHDVCRSSSSP
jgi:hypothetical protein